jgi:hypothetical protein
VVIEARPSPLDSEQESGIFIRWPKQDPSAAEIKELDVDDQ